MGFPVGSVVKNQPASAGDAGDVGSVSGLGQYPRERNGNPLQHSCLGNTRDRGAWHATIHQVTKSDTTEQQKQNKQTKKQREKQNILHIQ